MRENEKWLNQERKKIEDHYGKMWVWLSLAWISTNVVLIGMDLYAGYMFQVPAVLVTMMGLVISGALWWGKIQDLLDLEIKFRAKNTAVAYTNHKTDESQPGL